jgi:hypothetical protein
MSDERPILEALANEPIDNAGLTTAPPIPKVELKMADKEAFFKAFLSEQPYMETVILFGGKYSVKFKTLSVEENNDYVSQIVKDQEKGVAKSNDSYFLRMLLYRLGLSITEVNKQPFATEQTKENIPMTDTGSYITERINIFYQWPVFKLGGIQEAFKNFEYKVINLTKERF